MSATADRDWWEKVGELIGATLYGWDYRNSASFYSPQMEVNGRVAALLLDQRAEVGRLRTDVTHLRRQNKALHEHVKRLGEPCD